MKKLNLQVCVPYQKCPFNCPMCISNGRRQFSNLYKNDPEKYINILKEIVSSNRYRDIILTGNTDPTLDSGWLTLALDIFKDYPGSVELQTKNYNLHNYNLKGLKTLCYSIAGIKDYLKAPNFRKIEGNNRLVILLVKELEFLDYTNFNAFGFNQVTFKVLQPTADDKTNQWIEENRMKDLTKIYEIVNFYNGTGTSVRIDTNCQDSINRYRVFREDGEIYPDWETPPKDN